jgi:hypothetical protein
MSSLSLSSCSENNCSRIVLYPFSSQLVAIVAIIFPWLWIRIPLAATHSPSICPKVSGFSLHRRQLTGSPLSALLRRTLTPEGVSSQPESVSVSTRGQHCRIIEPAVPKRVIPKGFKSMTLGSQSLPIFRLLGFVQVTSSLQVFRHHRPIESHGLRDLLAAIL